MQIKDSNPRKDFFRMPGEFENHQGCWMLWPEREDNWRLKARPAQEKFIEIALTISNFELVKMGVSKEHYEQAKKMLPRNIEIFKISHDDSWARDTGPIFVVNSNKEIRAVDWGFNAWGENIYASYKKDKKVARNIINIEKIDYYKPQMILEGGAITVDGEGTLITVENCLLNPNRNPCMSKQQIEKKLKDYLNLEKIIWIKEGMYMDETDGHIDNLCVFARPGEIILLWTDDKTDPQYRISKNAYDLLNSSVDAKGRKFKIHKIHQPKPKYRTKEDIKGIKKIKGTIPRKKGERLPMSYINFYLTNGGVIMPKFNDQYDEVAFKKMQEIFPERKIVQIESHEIILGGGGIHCITQQIPK